MTYHWTPIEFQSENLIQLFAPPIQSNNIALNAIIPMCCIYTSIVLHLIGLYVTLCLYWIRHITTYHKVGIHQNIETNQTKTIFLMFKCMQLTFEYIGFSAEIWFKIDMVVSIQYHEFHWPSDFELLVDWTFICQWLFASIKIHSDEIFIMRSFFPPRICS